MLYVVMKEGRAEHEVQLGRFNLGVRSLAIDLPQLSTHLKDYAYGGA